jgi:uncharacterized YigZ family protein
MYSVKENKKNEIIIKKSKFITYIYRLNKINEIDDILTELKHKYKDATHCCYAYIFDNNVKASDDNEPSKTAGTPILEVLKKNNLNYVLCVVIRYFGGIKLGAGGLIRAYSSSCKEILYNNIIELEDGYLIEINTTYDKQKNLDYLIKEDNIINKEYKVNIKLTVKATKDLLNKLDNNNITYKIIKNIKIEKSS